MQPGLVLVPSTLPNAANLANQKTDKHKYANIYGFCITFIVDWEKLNRDAIDYIHQVD